MILYTHIVTDESLGEENMVKVGVIGCGYWGAKLARNFHELPDAQLEWVADMSQERLDHIHSLYPQVQTTRDYHDLLGSDVDAVAIATPVSTHYCLAVQALLAKKHVLVEKPLTAGVREAEEIVALAKHQGHVLMVEHTFEYNPAVEAMKTVLNSGELGEIYYINGIRVNLGLFQTDINVLWDLAPHDVSILAYVLSAMPESVSARGEAYVQRERHIHDIVHLTLHFPNHVMADVRVSWLDPCKIRRYTIVGSRKMLVYDDLEPENKILIYDKGVDAPPHSDTEEQFRLSYRYGDATPYPVTWSEPLKAACQHFLDCIRDKKVPRSNGEVGLKVVRVLEAAQRSLMDGGRKEPILC